MAKVARRFSLASAYQRLNVIDEQSESSQSDARSRRSRSGSMFSRSRRSSTSAPFDAATAAAAAAAAAAHPGVGSASLQLHARKGAPAPLYRLQTILDTPSLLAKFRDFLTAEHCGENLLFLEAVVEFNDIVRDVRRRKHDKYARCRCRKRVLQKAHQVFDEFLSPVMSKAPLGVAGRNLRAIEATLDAHSLKLRYDFVKELQKQAKLHEENRCEEATANGTNSAHSPRARLARSKTARFIGSRKHDDRSVAHNPSSIRLRSPGSKIKHGRSMTLNPSRGSRALSPLARVSTTLGRNPRSPRGGSSKNRASTLTRRTSQSLIRMFTGGGSGGGGGGSDDSDGGGNEGRKKRRGRRKSKGDVYAVPEDASSSGNSRRRKSRSRSRSRSRAQSNSRRHRKNGTTSMSMGGGSSVGSGTFSSLAAALSPRSRRKASLASQASIAVGDESDFREEETEALTASCRCGERFDLEARVKAANACSTSQLIGNTEHDPKLRCSMTRRKSAPFTSRSYALPPQIHEEEAKSGESDLIPVTPGASNEDEFGFSLHEILAVTRGPTGAAAGGQKQPLIATGTGGGSEEKAEQKKEGSAHIGRSSSTGGFSTALSSPRRSNAGFLVPKRPSLSHSGRGGSEGGGSKTGHKLSPASSGGGGKSLAAPVPAGYDILEVKDFDWQKYNDLGLVFVREDTSGDDFRDQPEIFKYEYYARERQDVLLKRHLLHEHNIVTEDLSKLPQSPACVAFNCFADNTSSYDKTPLSLPSPRAALARAKSVGSPAPSSLAPLIAKEGGGDDAKGGKRGSTTIEVEAPSRSDAKGSRKTSPRAEAEKHSRSASRASVGSSGHGGGIGGIDNFTPVSWQLEDLFQEVYTEVYQLLSSEKLARFNMQSY